MTPEYLGLLGLDALVLAVGISLLYGIGLARSLRDGVRLLGLAFVVGWAALGLALSLALVAGAALTVLQTAVLAVGVVAAGVVLSRAVPAARAEPPPPPMGPLARAVTCAAVALLLLYLDALLRALRLEGASDTWDAWAFWVPKSKSIYYFGGLDTGPGGFASFAHPDYPPLMPAIDAVVFRFAGEADAALLPIHGWVLAVAFLGALAGLLVRRVPAWLLWPSIATVAFMPSFADLVGSSLGDEPLALLLGVAALAGSLWLVTAEIRYLALAGLFLAAGAWTKNEGLVLGLLLVAALALGARLERRRMLPLAAVAPLAVVAILPWRLWLSESGVRSASDYALGDLLRPGYLTGRLDRLGTALGELPGYVFDVDRWLLAVPLALVAALLASGRARGVAAFEIAFVGVGFLGLACIYWISRLPLAWHIETSAGRVVASLAVVSGVLLPLLLARTLEPRSGAPR